MNIKEMRKSLTDRHIKARVEYRGYRAGFGRAYRSACYHVIYRLDNTLIDKTFYADEYDKFNHFNDHIDWLKTGEYYHGKEWA